MTSSLTRIMTNGGMPFTVDSAYADQFKSLLNDLEASGYKINSKASGGYNYRNIAGTNTLSKHATGDAVDINWDSNARGTKGNIDPSLARSLATKYGLTWGGDWSNPDPMHFETGQRIPTPGKSITAWAGLAPDKDGAFASPTPSPPVADSSVPPTLQSGVGRETSDPSPTMASANPVPSHTASVAPTGAFGGVFDGLAPTSASNPSGSAVGALGQIASAFAPSQSSGDSGKGAQQALQQVQQANAQAINEDQQRSQQALQSILQRKIKQPASLTSAFG